VIIIKNGLRITNKKYINFVIKLKKRIPTDFYPQLARG